MEQNYMQELLNKYGKNQKTEPRMVQYAREYAERNGNTGDFRKFMYGRVNGKFAGSKKKK